MEPAERFGYDERIPEPIRHMYMPLCQDVAMLHHKWEFYLELFGKAENTTLMSNVAPAAFNIIEESVRNDLTMSICRLADPATMGGNENLTLARLADECRTIPGIDRMWLDFRTACEPFVAHRNKRVGHNDLDRAISPSENPLPGVSRQMVEGVLRLAASMLQAVQAHFSDAERSFVPHHFGGADALMYWLKQGWEQHKKRLQEMSGSAHQDPN